MQNSISTPTFSTSQYYFQNIISNRMLYSIYLIFWNIYLTCGCLCFYHSTHIIVIILLIYPIWFFHKNLNGMGQHLLSLPTTELFFILNYKPLIFLIFLFCYIWIFCINLNFLGWKNLFLSTTELFSILLWSPILFLILIFYSILLFCVDLSGMVLYLFFLTAN